MERKYMKEIMEGIRRRLAERTKTKSLGKRKQGG
jgi:hypothetical protein